MFEKLLKSVALLTLIASFVAGCAAPVPQTQSGAAVTPANVSVATTALPVVPTTVPVIESALIDPLVIYVPASASSIPVILASQKMENVKLQLYNNQAQVNALYLRGEIDVFVTGLAVGVDFYKKGIPVQMVNSFVAGLSYMVTYGKKVNSISELKDSEIVVPFEGSPIEEVMTYLANEEGLTWGKDLTPVYAPFQSSVELLRQGKATAVVLPEPNVTLVEGVEGVNISFSLFDAWNQAAGVQDGYPQVATFVEPAWAAVHPQQVAEFNQALTAAIAEVQQDPKGSIALVETYFKLSPAELEESLSRTRYSMQTGLMLQKSIEKYYQLIGNPLNVQTKDFYFSSGQ
jgi:ABC-type nitrate/sulfonate/bicarbonate transport system substrate-binding protein